MSFVATTTGPSPIVNETKTIVEGNNFNDDNDNDNDDNDNDGPTKSHLLEKREKKNRSPLTISEKWLKRPPAKCGQQITAAPAWTRSPRKGLDAGGSLDGKRGELRRRSKNFCVLFVNGGGGKRGLSGLEGPTRMALLPIGIGVEKNVAEKIICLIFSSIFATGGDGRR